MTAPVICRSGVVSAAHVRFEMQKHGIHHMPVADENEALIGIISVTDIFMAAEEIGWGEEQ